LAAVCSNHLQSNQKNTKILRVTFQLLFIFL
jgi:hypothetical protein